MKSKIIFLLLASVTILSLSAQNQTLKSKINGKVVDANQEPVSNAIIVIDSVKTKKTTKKDGSFCVKFKGPIEKIGIFTQQSGLIEEVINGRTTINFTLPISIQKVLSNRNMYSNEEEINTGYGYVKRKNLTQSISKLDRKNDKVESYTTIYEMIRGKIPGVQVIGNKITIQGASSLNTSTEPLFVVDGIVYNSIDHISPKMVKSIEVLKGSSAAIYGSRGANGVILINLINAGDMK